MEKLILDAKREWECAMDASEDAMYILGRNGCLLRANKTFFRMIDSAPEEAIGRKIAKVIHPQGEDHPCPICSAMEEKRDAVIIMEKDHPGNPVGRPLEVTVKVVRDEEDQFISIFVRLHDLTAKRETEETLFQSQKMEAVGTLAGGIAHDFNNILSSIIGYAEFVKEEIAAGSQAAQDIEQVITSSLRAKELVRQLLDFSRRSPRKPENLAPGPIVREALKMLRSTIPTSITIEEDLDSTMGMIMAESIGLQQIILNLCTNAMHAIEDRNGSITVKLKEIKSHEGELGEVCSIGAGPFIVLTVRDTGCGMDQDTQDKIFDPYFTTKEPGKGSGMGLAVVHGIVSEFGGCIHVKSSLGKGSVFSVHFPVSGAIAPFVTPAATDSGAGSDMPGRERIFVVDDDPLIVRVHQRQLEKQGYFVTTTTDSKKALAMIRSRPDDFDLIITDHSMPGLTGVELGKEVMKIKPSIPIVLCTGHSDGLSEKKALDYGIRRYVSKPIHRNELIDVVREVLDEGV